MWTNRVCSPPPVQKRPSLVQLPVGMSKKTLDYVSTIKIRAGTYAILMAIYFYSHGTAGKKKKSSTQKSPSCSNDEFFDLTKEEIQRWAQSMCNSAMVQTVPVVGETRSLVQEVRSAWHSISTLESNKHCLVRRDESTKDKHRFVLTTRGVYFCQKLLKTRAQDILDAYEEMKKTKSDSDGSSGNDDDNNNKTNVDALTEPPDLQEARRVLQQKNDMKKASDSKSNGTKLIKKATKSKSKRNEGDESSSEPPAKKTLINHFFSPKKAPKTKTSPTTQPNRRKNATCQSETTPKAETEIVVHQPVSSLCVPIIPLEPASSALAVTPSPAKVSSSADQNHSRGKRSSLAKSTTREPKQEEQGHSDERHSKRRRTTRQTTLSFSSP